MTHQTGPYRSIPGRTPSRAEAPVSAWSDAGCSRCGKGAGEEVEYLTLQAAGRTARLCPECFERAAAALRAAWETDA